MLDVLFLLALCCFIAIFIAHIYNIKTEINENKIKLINSNYDKINGLYLTICCYLKEIPKENLTINQIKEEIEFLIKKHYEN